MAEKTPKLRIKEFLRHTLGHLFKLTVVQFGIEAALGHQLVVRAALGDAPVLDDLLVRRVGAAELDVIFDGVREEADVLVNVILRGRASTASVATLAKNSVG